MGAYDRIKRGSAADLGGTHFRSSWERNVARWLNWRIEQGEVVSWEFEPHRFTFPGVLRGPGGYTPDFRLVLPDGSVEWLEVKGRELPADRSKWKRMKQFYPEVKLTVLGADTYKSLQSKFGGLPFWER